MKQYLFSFTHGVGDGFPTDYQLVYAETEELALKKLKEHFFFKIYDIESCTTI